MTDQKQIWWIWGVTYQRLSKWALALLHGRRYTIRLQPEGTGFHTPVEKIIQVNPQLFPLQPVEVQFRLTQGLLAHECGHAWFTGCWLDQSENVLQELANMLEDERIERGICTLYPGVGPAIRLLGDLVYNGMERTPDEAHIQAYTCCLAWRWAHNRTNEKEMFERLCVSNDGQRLWVKIRSLVEQAWTAPDTQTVISLARDILRILDIPKSTPRLGLVQVNTGDIPIQGTKPIPIPIDPSDCSPGLGTGLASEDLPGIPARRRALDAAPYLELEGKVLPHATRLADALKEPQPEQRLSPHEYRGRFSFRQEIRTPDTPHLAYQEMGQAARSLALYVLVDRSGSMDRFEPAVREALMTIYLAAGQVSIPIGMAYFGEDEFYIDDSHLPADLITVEQTVAEVSPLSIDNDEMAKALIAGYTGWSCEEYLDWGLRKAEAELRTRPERLLVLIIIHDGEPVYHGSSVSDWDLSLAHLRSLEQIGIITIGLHLGNDNLEKLHILFPRLVNCPKGETLPDKLGSMLSSLA
jgi:hypothetical protein